jgi:hypothetical protein
LEEAAYGAFLVGCAGIARAVRAVTIERGRDPRDFTLIAFGGNGPLFAAEMARTLAIGTVLVPPAPGVFSAVGLLEADLEHHLVRTLNAPLAELTDDAVDSAFEGLADEARGLMREAASPLIERAVDAKYVGQSLGAFRANVRAMPGDGVVWPSLSEVFGLEPAYLEQRYAGLVSVIIGGDDPGHDLDPKLRLQPLDCGAVLHAALDGQQLQGSATDMGLVIEPLPALRSADFDRNGTVRSEALLRFCR